VAISEQPSAQAGVYRYRVTVSNHAIGAAENVQVRDLFPKIGDPRFIDGLVNWTCTAQGAGASCGSVNEGAGRVDLVSAFLPAHLPGGGSPPRLTIDVERSFANFDTSLLGLAFRVYAAATTAAPGLPDRNRATNSAALSAVVSEPAGPIAVDDAFDTDQDTSIVRDVTANDDHALGQSFFVARVNGSEAGVGVPVVVEAAPAWGSLPATVTVQSNGQMSFDPGEAFIPVPRDQSALASFTYTLRDSADLESTATVTITVAGLNDAPVGGDASFEIPAIGAVFTAPGVLGASFDPDGDALSVVTVDGSGFVSGLGFTLPSGAILTMFSDGSFSYNPNGAVGPGGNDSFSIELSDGELTDVARITILIDP
jgi:hypothetical protein